MGLNNDKNKPEGSALIFMHQESVMSLQFLPNLCRAQFDSFSFPERTTTTKNMHGPQPTFPVDLPR